MPDLKAIYHAESANAGLDRSAEFEDKWDARYRATGQTGAGHASTLSRHSRSRLPSARRSNATSTAKSLNRSQRKIEARGSLPNDGVAVTPHCLVIRNAGIH